MKKSLVLLILLAIFAGIPPVMAGAATIKHATPKTIKIVKKIKPTPTPKVVSKKAVRGASTKAVIYSFFTGSALADCHMPDGKTIRVSKKDCDAVNDFWDAHKPSNPGNSNNGGSNNGSNNNSGSNEPSHEYHAPTITSAEIMPCTSSSCGIITTIKVTGGNFNAESRVELTGNGTTYGQNTNHNYTPDAQLTGGNGVDTIIMDFYNLPCLTYGVQLAVGGAKYSSTATVTKICK